MKPHHFNFWRWLPIGASLALMILIIVVSAVTVAQSQKATRWREHTFQVILDAQALEDKLSDAQRSEHGYAAHGSPNLLVEYKNDTNAEIEDFNELARLTRDDPAQQQRLKELASAMRAIFENDSRVISIYAQQGPRLALQADDDVKSEDMAEAAITNLEKYTGNEKKLLAQEDAAEQKDYHRAAHVLVAASVLVAVLLVLANYIAGREMNRRRLAELRQRELIDELQTALAEVKTLSGLIPICAWCKNVRNDRGYWSTVEQYVKAHTDADFSHGMCPECREKFKAEILSRTQPSEKPV